MAAVPAGAGPGAKASNDGLRTLKGGEELRRAKAALQTGALSHAQYSSSSTTQLEGLQSSLERPNHAPLIPLPEGADINLKELAAAAQRYSQLAAEAPEDYDSVYNHGLALQELAARLGSAQAEQLQLLQQAGKCYEAAVQLRPTSHAALYNWGVALSDMARVQRSSDPAAAIDHLISAADKYSASLQWHAHHPQALNNWGLVLQELASERPPAERRRLTRHSVAKFRRAMRQRPEFDRACYNLGTVFYAHACQLQHSAQQHLSSQLTQDAEAHAQEKAQEALIRSTFALAAQYIVLAHVLQPGREVYQRSLGVVQPLLPLPYLRTGWLQALAPAAGPFQERWQRYFFVLDQDSLRTVDPEESVQPPPGRSRPEQQASSSPTADGDAEAVHRFLLSEIVSARTCSDASLPQGHALWLGLRSHPEGSFLVSESSADAEGWSDALALLAHLAASGQLQPMVQALRPQSKRPTKAAVSGTVS
ncbi:hypothetical protein WJX73_010014 [Symbiochloris irregularis]|uniref:PH domain-containing protein n=1 Tax=Symbiochloris irregularis TaxID=706552 RepID=A0AAW1PFT4_9CHLO